MSETNHAAEIDATTVCVAHGAFIPCRKHGEHRYTSNPYWVKSVRDYQTSTIAGLTWEPAWPNHAADHVADPDSMAGAPVCCCGDRDGRMTYRCIWLPPGSLFPAHADHSSEEEANRHALRMSREIQGEVAVVPLPNETEGELA